MIWGTLVLASALGGNLAPTEGKIVAASLFKNGYVVVVRAADLDRDGRVALKPTVGSLGTLWISAGKGVSLQKAKVESIVSKSSKNVETFDELLTANVGKDVIINTNISTGNGLLTVAGKLKSADGPMIVIQETDAATSAFLKSSVTRIVARTADITTQVPTTSSERVISVQAQGSGQVFIVSLERGMTWAPAYQVDLVDDKNLSITAKATILNDLADLDNISVNLVTGFPNLKYLETPDPLTSGQTVDQYVQGLAYATTGTQFRRDAMMQNQSGSAGFGGGALEGMPSTGSGQQLEDLFFYTQPGVSLKNGERGYYILFQAKSPYKTVYTLEVPDEVGGTPQPARQTQPEESLDVWHTLKFENTAGMPFTTAPVMTIKNGEVLGQDMMSYTTAGAEATVRVSKALDIHAESAEEETARDRGVLKIEGRPAFDKVTMKGTIEIKNRKQKNVDLVVTKSTTGEVTSAGEGTVRKVPAGLRQVNPVSEVTWKPTLKPGETLRLEYTYQVYVSSQGY